MVRRIVIFKKGFSDPTRQRAFLREHGAKIVRDLGIINGVAIEIPREKEGSLLKASEVSRVDTDEAVVRAL